MKILKSKLRNASKKMSSKRFEWNSDLLRSMKVCTCVYG